jgi:hypothetical protein
MSQESRIKRWRANKREQGLKHVSVWLTPEEELHLKDLAIQWHCSPSQVVQRALAQMSTSAPDYSSPPDTLRIRELILAELEALGITMPSVIGRDTVGNTVGPTDTQPPNIAPTHPAPGQTKLTPLQIAEMRGKRAAGVPIKALMDEYGISKATLFRYLK